MSDLTFHIFIGHANGTILVLSPYYIRPLIVCIAKEDESGAGHFVLFSGRRLDWVEGNLLENTVPLLTGILPRDSLSGAVSVASGTASPFTPGQAEVRWLTLREEEDGFLAGRWPMLLCPLLSGCKQAQYKVGG